MPKLTLEQERAIADLVAVVADLVYSQMTPIINEVKKLDMRNAPLGATLDQFIVDSIDRKLIDIADDLHNENTEHFFDEDPDSKFVFNNALEVLRKT